MKHLIFAFTFLFFCQFAHAQKIKITETTEIIDKITRTGLGVTIELDKKDVQKAWEKHLKSYGKVESSKGSYLLQVAKVPTISSNPCQIFSEIKSTKNGVYVWWAIDMGTSFVTSATDKSAFKAAEKILYDFAYNAYAEDINEQIKDAEKALSNSVKGHEKEIKNGQKLEKDVENNAKEKEKLEKALQQNAKDLQDLKKDIEQNKKDQKAAAEDVEKMKKAVDMVKQKLNSIDK